MPDVRSIFTSKSYPTLMHDMVILVLQSKIAIFGDHLITYILTSLFSHIACLDIRYSTQSTGCLNFLQYIFRRRIVFLLFRETLQTLVGEFAAPARRARVHIDRMKMEFDLPGGDKWISVSWAFKLDHLHPVKPILFPKFSYFFTFILGSPIPYYPRRQNMRKGK